METSHNTSTTENMANIRARFRSGLIVLGIVTSVICLLILVKDIRLGERSEASLMGKISKIVPANLTTEASTIRISSAILSLW